MLAVAGVGSADCEGYDMGAVFETHLYEAKHGKRPRGVQTWAFTPADSIWPDRDAMPSDAIVWAWGSYSDAKREVARLYPAVDRWLVAP